MPPLSPRDRVTIHGSLILADRADRHRALKAALLPVAVREIEKGEHFCARRDCPESVKHVARIIASYAAADMCLREYTLMLPMDEVREAIRDNLDREGIAA